MDMYEKRNMRKNKKDVKSNNEEQNTTKTNINWDIGTNVKPLSIPYKISVS